MSHENICNAELLLSMVAICFKLLLSLIYYSAESAEMYGMKFKLGVAIITCTKDKIDPKFAEVQSIYIINNKMYLGGTSLEILEYSTHYHSWIVQKQEQRILIDAKVIPSKQILTLRPVRGTYTMQFFITLKHAL